MSTLVHPDATLRDLARRRDLALAFRFVLAYGLLYAGTALALALRRRAPVHEPYLRIPAARYYWWQTAFTVPVVLAGWLVLGATAWAVLRLAHRPTSLRGCLAVLAFSAYAPLLAGMWTTETVVAVGFRRYWGAPPGSPAVVRRIGRWYLPAVVVWAAALSVLGLRRAADASWPASTLAASAGMGASVGSQMLVIR